MKQKLLIQFFLRRLLIILPIAMLGVVPVFAQHTVTGTVYDENTNEPLPGATIAVEGTNLGATANMDGNYEITVETGNETLAFSFIGYQRLLLPIEGRTEINVELTPDVFIGEELVVTGYGFQRKEELTGSITVVEPQDIQEIATHNPLQALQGRVAGLNVQRDGTPGGGTQSVLIRGLNTLGNNEPLIVIDGQPVGRAQMDLLNSNDIESMQILKDAAAASIYGSRASNGVIIITTKRATPGELRIEVNSSSTIQDFNRSRSVLNTEDYGRVRWRANVNDGQDPNQEPHFTYDWTTNADGTPVLNNIQVVDWLDENAQGGIRSADTDWFDVISQTGLLTRNNISLSSGGETHNLMMSVGHHYNRGVIRFTDYERLSARINSSFDFFDGRLRVGENLQLTTSAQTPESEIIGGTPMRLAVRQLPILPIYAEDGSFSGPIGAGMSDRMNPLATASLNQNYSNDVSSLFGSLYLRFDIRENLVFNSNFGLDYNDKFFTQINQRYQTGFLSRDLNDFNEATHKTREWTWFNTLTYDLDVGENHSATILGGIEATRNDFSFTRVLRENFLIEEIDFFQIDAGSGRADVSGNATGFRLLSYFSKVNYSYSNRYLATATLRYDGSSRFGDNERFGFFPAASLGWRVSNEDFFMSNENLDFISQLTLRAGAGSTGNQQIDNDASFAKFIPGYGRARFLCCATTGRPTGSAYDLNGAGSGTLPSGVIQTQLANQNLLWESTDEINIGADFGFLQQRITGTFDYFWRETSDILVLPPRLATFGEGSDLWENGATVENRGWEFVIGYNDQRGDFGYRFNFSVGSFEDKVTFLPESVVRSFPGNVEKTILGRSITSNFGYVTDGIFQNQAEVDAHAEQPGKGVGRLRYADLNEDGSVTNLDQDWLGDEISDYEYGLNSVLSYRNYRLTIFFQGVQGVERFNARKNMDLVGLFSGENLSSRTLDAWTPENPNSEIPAVSLTDSNNETRMSNYFIEDMSYLKLKNLQFTYTLPLTFQQRIGVSRADIYIAGTDLFQITSSDFTGADPENPQSFYPIPRTLTLGFNVAF